MTQALKIAVMGAGAVGCYYGGMLARAGHQVVLIARPEHVAAINRDGLRLQTQTFDEQVRLTASSDVSALQGAELVLFCVKSTSTEAAGELMRPYLSNRVQVLCLQNGVDNADRVQAVLPGIGVAAAVVYVASEIAGPGHVRHNGRGELVIEPFGSQVTPQDQGISSTVLAEALESAGVPTQISNNVRGALWAKLILNCAYNAVSAISRQPYGEMVRGAGVQELMRDVVAECQAVALADGVQVPGDVNLAVLQIAQTMAGQYSSTAQDLMRGKPSEIDHLNGLVVQRGQALGIATPVNRVLWALVKLLEKSALEVTKNKGPHSSD